MKCKEFILGADKTISMKASKTAELKATQALTVNGGQMLVLTAQMTKIN